MERPGRQVSYLDKFEHPEMLFHVLTDITATDMAFGEDRGMLAFIRDECSLGDWGFDVIDADGVKGKLTFLFANETDAILFKMKFVG